MNQPYLQNHNSDEIENNDEELCEICNEEHCKSYYHDNPLHYCQYCDVFLQSNILYCEGCRPTNNDMNLYG